MTLEEIINKAKESPALDMISNRKGTFAYPEKWGRKVPLKIRMLMSVRPDISFLSKPGTICKDDQEYYCWVNSYGAVSAILPNGEQLGLKPDEFEVVEFHPQDVQK